jgi:bacterioferritin-associated ferredoxin
MYVCICTNVYEYKPACKVNAHADELRNFKFAKDLYSNE